MLAHFIDTAESVLLAVLPLAVLFLLFQVLFLQLPVREVTRILTGTLVAMAGLFLFLVGMELDTAQKQRSGLPPSDAR